MELQEFFERFLPDDYKKHVESYPQFAGDEIIDFFPEAIENFTNQICEKQRKNCAIDFYGTAKEAILKAEQPKIN